MASEAARRAAGDETAALIPAPLGRIVDPATGRTISARLNKERAKEIVDASINSAAAELTDAELAEVVTELEAATKSAKGGKRTKMRGGEEGGPARAATMERLKDVMGKVLEYAATETGPIGTSVQALARGTATLAQEVIVRVPVTLTVLTVSSGTLTANFLSSLFMKFNQWGRATATKNEDPKTAEAAAIAAVKDLPSIAKTTAAGTFILNQLGLLPMSVVFTVLLYALRVNVGTGTGRSLLMSQFYTWYIVQPKQIRDKLKADAQTYASQAGKAGSKAALDLAATLLKAGESGKNAFQTIKEAAIAAGAKDVKEPASTDAAAAEIVGAGNAVAQVVAIVSSTPAAVPASSSSSSSSSSSAAPLLPATSSLRSRRPLGPPKDATVPSSQSSPVSTASTRSSKQAREKAPLVSPGKKTKGGRKTQRKPKRRVTRRKPLVFHY